VRNTTLGAASVITSYLFIPWPRVADGQLNPLLSQGWTLNYEAFFYLAFAVALLFRRGLWWLAGGFLLLAAVHPWIPAEQFALAFWSNPIILEFLGGVGLALLFLRGHRLPRWASLGLAALAVAIFLLTETVAAGAFRRIIHVGLPALMLCASLALAPEPAASGPIRRALVKGGDSSYTLYLSHTFTINAAAILWNRSGSPVPQASMALAIFAAVAAAAIVYRWVERPMTDALHSLAGTPRARGVAAVAP
jgi:peptidoglycan/LPS O-acetylase OafA/YrhL